MNNQPKISLEFTDEFKRQLRKLFKKYRSIKQDLQPLLEQLQNGEVVGDRLSGVGDRIIYKVRVKNSDIKKGKSAGYLVIYLMQTESKIFLLTIYSKSNRVNISTQALLEMMQNIYGDG